mgnify:CR=1 FL=1
MQGFKSLLLALFMLPGLAHAGEVIPDDQAVLIFESKLGVVTFNHALHATVRGIECQSCHHTHQEGEPIKPCGECHKKKKSEVAGFSVLAPKESKAYHNKCKGCHKYTLEELHQPAGPTKSKLCHIKGG